MKVREIMKSPVISVTKDNTIKEAVNLLEKNDINGAAVLDRGRLVGMITRADIFRSILPSYTDICEDERYLKDHEFIEERIERVSSMKVAGIMSTAVVSVGPDTPIIKAGSIMLLNKIKQMPVTSGDEPLGIVTLTDISRNILERCGSRVAAA